MTQSAKKCDCGRNRTAAAPNPTVKSGIKIVVASVGSIPPGVSAGAIAGDRSPIGDRQSDRQRAMVQIAEGIEPPIRDS